MRDKKNLCGGYSEDQNIHVGKATVDNFKGGEVIFGYKKKKGDEGV